MVPQKLIAAFCTVLFISIPAASLPMLVVHKSDGSVEKIAIADIDKITFAFNENSGNRRSVLSGLKKITSVIKTNTLFADIPYTLKKNGRITVSAYTLSGKKIRTIRDGIESAGMHTCTWDYTGDTGAKIPNGSYIIHVERDGEPWSKCLFIVQ